METKKWKILSQLILSMNLVLTKVSQFNAFLQTKFFLPTAYKKHIEKCSGQKGIPYSFDNGKIISFQDNFKFLGDFPLKVYVDFEIQLEMIFWESKIYVISYCQTFSFHPSLAFKKYHGFSKFSAVN